MTDITYLKQKLKQAHEDIRAFNKQANAIVDSFNWYPECHNDSTKIKCDNCIGCMDDNCNRSMCDSQNRCMCEGTSCICIGR